MHSIRKDFQLHKDLQVHLFGPCLPNDFRSKRCSANAFGDSNCELAAKGDPIGESLRGRQALNRSLTAQNFMWISKNEIIIKKSKTF